MANMAEFQLAPEGTQRRTGPQAEWVDASVGDKLGENHESRNIHSHDYRVRLYPEAQMKLDTIRTVSLSNIVGTVEYLDSSGEWVKVSDAGQYAVAAVTTGKASGVSITCSYPLVFPPPPLK